MVWQKTKKMQCDTDARCNKCIRNGCLYQISKWTINSLVKGVLRSYCMTCQSVQRRNKWGNTSVESYMPSGTSSRISWICAWECCLHDHWSMYTADSGLTASWLWWAEWALLFSRITVHHRSEVFISHLESTRHHDAAYNEPLELYRVVKCGWLIICCAAPRVRLQPDLKCRQSCMAIYVMQPVSFTVAVCTKWTIISSGKKACTPVNGLIKCTKMQCNSHNWIADRYLCFITRQLPYWIL